MRTTLTLDEDVARLLQKEVRRTGAPFKQVVNQLLRVGLAAPKKAPRKRFVVKPFPIGLPPFTKVEELLERLEGPEHR